MRAAALVLVLLASAAPSRAEAPGLFCRGARIEAKDWLAHKDALDRLTERFAASARPLFRLKDGRRLVTGLDDLAHHPVRDTAGAMHDAIDVGSRVQVGDSLFFETLGEAPVYAVSPLGRVEIRHGGAYMAQRIVLSEGPCRLVLDVIYAHVLPAFRRGDLESPIGVLDGGDDWRALDPAWRRVLPYKGNHVHLLVRGVNDLPESNARPRDPAMKEYAEYRARFYNERLLPRLLGGR